MGFGDAESLMDADDFDSILNDFVDRNWDLVVDDIARAIAIPSVEDLDGASPGMPYGPRVAQAMDLVLDVARQLGLNASSMEGYIGIADLPGKSPTQLAIIGHVDVVDAGPGWQSDPFVLTRREGYLLGRGVLDDKGPVIVALYAVGFWAWVCREFGFELPYTIRFLVGGNEETGMADVVEYRKRHADPAFLFTPDAEFPVCYGEKGICNIELMGPALEDTPIVAIEGGMAVNAVPGSASATIRYQGGDTLPKASGISVESVGDGLLRITALGTSAHASTPELGVNAIGILASYLVKNVHCGEAMEPFLTMLADACFATDGSSFGMDCSDSDFGPLTLACGMIFCRDGRLVQTLDVRYPTSIDSEEILRRCTEHAGHAGATAEMTLNKPPFLVPRDSDVVQALLGAYNEATGESGKPFTMGGGTYARLFERAASFGPEKPWEKTPEWVGSMHGPNEGVSEELLREALRIYAVAIGRLMRLDL